jgi:hypothetical protein
VLPEAQKKDPKIFTKASIIFLVVWLGLNILFVILEVEASTVMGFLGSVLCFLFTYAIPIRIIWKAGRTVYMNTKD